MDIEFAKGHGTRNDFVLFADPDNLYDLTAEQVRYLCDRRAGIGGDGVLRAVRTNQVSQWAGSRADWFMDYRNADGSIAEMCGNGLRVFLRFLAEEDLIDPSGVTAVATRAGLRSGWLVDDGRIAVSMGAVSIGDQVTISHGGRTWPATAADVGNPHAVVEVASAAELDGLDLSLAPTWSPADAFPNGVNTEFVLREGPGRLRLRVFERGVGETDSCGTSVVASAAVLGGAQNCAVQVLGGRLEVRLGDPDAVLIGPAAVVARGRIDLPS